jgi:tRNA(Ile)-lysidine synthase
MDLTVRIRERLINQRLFSRGRAVLVAVSGGVDSMVLLHILHELAAQYDWKLKVAHLNHQLRGRSSDADEQLVRRTALSLKIPLVVHRTDVRRFQKREGLSLEMAARRLRHDFLARTAKRHSIRTVALAHHADDQVELFFLRLFRGAGMEAMAGMEASTVSPSDGRVLLVRPLLDESKAALLKYAASKKIEFREDASNADFEMLRNRVRHELLPLLRRAYQPFSNDAILRVMEVCRAEADVVESAALNWLKDFSKRKQGQSGTPFATLSLAVQRRCLHLQLLKLKIVPNFELIEHLRLHPDRNVSATPRTDSPAALPLLVFRNPGGQVAVRKNTEAKFDPERKTLILKRTGNMVFQKLRIKWQVTSARTTQKPRALPNMEQFDADKVGPTVVLRHWQPGDRFHPIGMTNAVKLQDLFVNLKIPRTERHKRVVAAAANGQIFWVEGIRIAEPFKLHPGTRCRLKWQWNRR